MSFGHPASATLLAELTDAAAHLEGRRIGPAAAALDRATAACGDLEADGGQLPADVLAMARRLHDSCGEMMRAHDQELQAALRNVGVSRSALRGYRRTARR